MLQADSLNQESPRIYAGECQVDELLSITEEAKNRLLVQGLKVLPLPGEGVTRAIALASAHPVLSTPDCFARVLAEQTQNSILLSGDRALREVSTARGIEVHGVLWVLDEMLTAAIWPLIKSSKCSPIT